MVAAKEGTIVDGYVEIEEIVREPTPPP